METLPADLAAGHGADHAACQALGQGLLPRFCAIERAGQHVHTAPGQGRQDRPAVRAEIGRAADRAVAAQDHQQIGLGRHRRVHRFVQLIGLDHPHTVLQPMRLENGFHGFAGVGRHPTGGDVDHSLDPLDRGQFEP